MSNAALTEPGGIKGSSAARPGPTRKDGPPPGSASARHCAATTLFFGRKTRCDREARHQGWHHAKPRPLADISWDDHGGYEFAYPSVHIDACAEQASKEA